VDVLDPLLYLTPAQVHDLIQRFKSKEARVENIKQLIFDIEVGQSVSGLWICGGSGSV
jgi:hypothetical protein